MVRIQMKAEQICGRMLVHANNLMKIILCVMVLSCICENRADALTEENYITYDYSGNYRQYAETVACLNSQADKGITTFQAQDGQQDDLYGSEPVVVLCKTKGIELEPVSAGLICKVDGPGNCYTLYYASLDAAEKAVSFYNGIEGMVYAELDSEVKAASSSEEQTDIALHSWGAARMNFGDYINHAGCWGKGSSVVAVIDSGVCQHSFLNGKMPESGYDYIDADDDATNDIFGHGTHVAGIVADCTYGLPVYIYPIRVLNGVGSGKISNVVNAIMEAVEKGVDVINLSIESRVLSEALDEAILEALKSNVVVVVAAGNSACDTQDICPAHLKTDGILVVGAAEIDGDVCVRASYSNYGESVDIYAFGSDISSCSRTGGFVTNSGTSMAAPHISALSAMLRLIHPGLSPAAVEHRAVAASGVGSSIFVPDLKTMIPVSEGLQLHELRLLESEVICLPTLSMPHSSQESITYSIQDPSVLSFESGVLKAIAPGSTMVSASCTGLPDTSFEVIVEKAEGNPRLSFPDALICLEDEAFAGNQSIEWVMLPDGLSTIGNRVFDECECLRIIQIPSSVEEIGDNTFSNAVVLCEESSAALQFCQENNTQYIITQCERN